MADAQLIREITNMYNMLASSHYSYEQWISKLATLYGQVISGRITREEAKAKQAEIYQIFTRLSQLNKSFGSSVNKFNKQIGPQIVAQLKGGTQAQPQVVKMQSLINDLVKLADAFDKTGNRKLSDQIDQYVKSQLADMQKSIDDVRNLVFALIARTNRMEKVQQRKAELVVGITKLANFADEIGAFTLASELDKIAEEEATMPVQPPNEGNLSTRYCPDHNGTQAIRISERVYQCPIDGKVYNYETGYKNYKGQQVPGGSIAAQTPSTSDYGGIPMRIYDSRQTILNRVN